MKTILSILILTFMTLNFGCLSNDTEKYMRDLRSENITVRNNAVYFLGKKKEKRAVPLLVKLLNDHQQKKIELSAIKALGEIGDSGSVDALIAVVGKTDNDIRVATIEALGKIKDPRAVKALVALLENKDVQYIAIWALGNIGDKRATEPLTKLLNHQDKYVSYNAAQALKKIGSGK